MNRRDFLVGAGALTALAPFITMDAASAVGTCVLNDPIVDRPVKPQVAASMKRLLAEAKTGARPRLVNMTRIDGYTLEIDDIVLWGRSEPKESELPFDDLMVAFKSIRGAYGKGIPGST